MSSGIGAEAPSDVMFSLEEGACMCCVALRYRHSPKTLLPHNLNLLSKALCCKYTRLQDHLSYLSQLMLDQGGQRHSDNRPFSAMEEKSILLLFNQTNENSAYSETSTNPSAAHKLPPPLPFVAVLHANGYLPQPSAAAIDRLSCEVKCVMQNVATKYNELETKSILTEVARQEHFNCTEKGDIFDILENGPESRLGVDNTIACIVRRARRFVTAKCTDCDVNPPKRVGTSKKRSYAVHTNTSTSDSGRNEDTEVLRTELEEIFATVDHQIVDNSEQKRRRFAETAYDENTDDFDYFPFIAGELKQREW